MGGRGTSNKSIIAFNAGELSPLLDGRVDIDKYSSGCRQLQNAVIQTHGGAKRRAGTQYISEVKDSTKKVKLKAFEFSTSTTYCLEFGELYIRFYKDGAQLQGAYATWLTSTAYVIGDLVTDGGTYYRCLEGHTSGTFATDLAANKWVVSGGSADLAYEIVAPYSEGELFQLQFSQINDVMYVTHPNHSVMKLSRFADTTWTLADVVFDIPPFLPENLTTTTITASATTGAGITLTASDSVFESTHVGSYWQIAHLRAVSETEVVISSSNLTSSPLWVRGGWTVRTYEKWSADVLVERSTDGGTVWETLRTYNGTSDRNIEADGNEGTDALLRISVANHSSGTARAVLEADDAFRYGLVKITGYTSGTSVTATVVSDLHATTASKYWSEGAWSDKRGFPRTVTVFEQRLMFAGSDYEPQSVWGSATGEYENFRSGTADTDALKYSIAAKERNQIEWMLAQNRLLIGTSGGEWAAGSSNPDAAITPSNFEVKRQSTYGSKNLSALLVNEVALFVQRQGLKLREMAYSFGQDTYLSPDMTLLAEHITTGGVVDMDYQQQPDSIVWLVNGNGELLGMTYEREQQVVGWHRHVTDGTIESVTSLYGSADDEVWVSVKRTISGATVRYVERFNPTAWSAKEDAFYVDSGITYSGASTTTITGLTHLEGETVQILGDGAVQNTKVVASGQITLDTAVEKAQVGLAFETIIEPMIINVDSQMGNTQGQKKRIRSISVRMLNSLGFAYSDGVDEYQFPFRDTGDEMDGSPPLFSGIKEIEFDGDYGEEPTLIVKQTQPLPWQIQYFVVKYAVTGWS